MARVELDQPLRPSLLDRLIDEHPELRQDPPKHHGQYLAELRRAVRRDLEALLNTRQRCISAPANLTELQTSFVNYGIPDFSGLNLTTEAQRETFRATIEGIIRRYEPRFQKVRVVLLENVDALDRTLRFRIEALIYADPAPEPLVFDSYLEPVTHSFAVTAKDNG